MLWQPRKLPVHYSVGGLLSKHSGLLVGPMILFFHLHRITRIQCYSIYRFLLADIPYHKNSGKYMENYETEYIKFTIEDGKTETKALAL